LGLRGICDVAQEQTPQLSSHTVSLHSTCSSIFKLFHLNDLLPLSAI